MFEEKAWGISDGSIKITACNEKLINNKTITLPIVC